MENVLYRFDGDGPTVEEPEDAGGGRPYEEGGDGDGDRDLDGDAHQGAVRHMVGRLLGGGLRRLGGRLGEEGEERLAAGDGPRLGQTFARHRKQVEGTADSHLLHARLSAQIDRI